MNADSFEELYKSKTDEELQSLASEKGNLVESARQCLSAELRRRHLDALPAATVEIAATPISQSEEETLLESPSRFAWLGLFLVNVAVAYICAVRLAPMLAGRWFAWVVPIVGFPSGISAADWSLQHLPSMSILTGLVAGYIDLARSVPALVGKPVGRRSDSAAMWAWSVPCAALLYKMLVFQTPSSVLFHSSMSAFRYFFEIQQVVPTFANPFASDPVRVLAQMYITAPFYTGVAYSLGALASKYRPCKQCSCTVDKLSLLPRYHGVMSESAEHKRRRVFQMHETERLRALEGLRLATYGQRVLGYLIDIVLAVVIWTPLEFVWRRYLLHETKIDLKWDFHEAGNIVVMLLYWASWNYFGSGRTPGKFITGTRILSLTSERLGRWQSVERALGYGAAVLEGGLGFAQIFWDKNRMCAQDRLAETVVVDVRISKT